MIKNDFTLDIKDGEKLKLTVYGYENLNDLPCLVYVHGFKGFKDWGFIPYMGEYFAAKGYYVITFNFSHNGIEDNMLEFTRLDKFADNTFSREVSELSFIIDAYQNNFFGKTNNKKIGLIGHSRGGAVSLLTASLKNEISAAAVWGSISKLDRYTERQKNEWRKKGVFEVLNQRTGQIMRLNVSLLEDIEKNKNKLLNIENAVKSLNRPLLIAHGEQDLTVPVNEAYQLYEWSDQKLTELYIIEAASHTFNTAHPFERSSPKFDSVIEKTEKFLKKHLKL